METILENPPEHSVPIHIVDGGALEATLAGFTAAQKNWVVAHGFTGKLGTFVEVPGPDGQLGAVLFGWGLVGDRARGRFHLAKLAEVLPKGAFHIATEMDAGEAEEHALGWALASYRFDRFKAAKARQAQLVLPKGVDSKALRAIVEAEFLCRDLINTPASHMGPNDLEVAFSDLAARFGAALNITRGEDLLAENLPMIHAVGRASDQVPRLLDLRWGQKENPSLTLVGKGVCFDTGGLNLKPGSSMALMKKDMGGAATVMGLAQAIMALDLPLNLRVLVPAVENSVSAGAFRPGDVLTSRKGLTVEINNTDAEGRLVLADALALADEENPDLILCMATLTGAARIALGPDLAPFYTDDDDFAAALSTGATKVSDPVWRMPFWPGYEAMIEPAIADLDNAPSGGFAGSITAALFLRRFVSSERRFAHFDIFGWNPNVAPARPKGGAFLGGRAILAVLQTGKIL